MVSATARRRRRAVAGLVGMLAALALGGVFGLALNAGARTTDDATVSPTQYLSTSALGAAAGSTAVGLQSPYFDPPALRRGLPGSRW